MRNQNPTPPEKSPLHLRLLRDSTTVTITVGPTAHWTLPLPLLTTLSPFFAAAFHANHFRESHTHTISLPDDDPEIFELFVQWLFTSTFVNTDPRNIWTEKAWVLGDKLGVRPFKDECMRALWREYSEDSEEGGEREGEVSEEKGCNIFPPTIAYVYENTAPGSKLRAFLTDMVAENISSLDLEEEGEEEMGWKELMEAGGDFVVDLLKAVQQAPASAKDDEEGEVKEQIQELVEDLKKIGVGEGELKVEEMSCAKDGEERRERRVDVGCPSKGIGYYLEGGGSS